jgi:hypothetical protein
LDKKIVAKSRKQLKNNYMKKTHVAFLLIAFSFVACQQKIKPEDVSKLMAIGSRKVVFDSLMIKTIA